MQEVNLSNSNIFNNLKRDGTVNKSIVINHKQEISNYKVENKLFKNKSYLIVLTVMIVEGVLNDIYYAKGEMASSEKDWDTCPVVLNHPSDGFTAKRVEVLEQFGLGTLFGTKFELNEQGKGVLKSNVWFDEEVLKNQTPTLYKRVLNGETIEVSTGLRLNLIYADAEFNGTSFTWLSSNYVPDHLAILPDDIGACSCKDGCGLRLNVGDTASVESAHTNTYNKEYQDNKENEMANCNCPEKVAKLMELDTTLNKEDLIALNEAEIDEKLGALEATEVENTEVEVKEEVAEEVKEEIKEEAVAEEVKVEAKIEEVAPVVISNMEELSKIADKEFCNKLNEALAFISNAKAEKVKAILDLPNNKFFKAESLNCKSFDELEGILALAKQPINYGLQSNVEVKQNKAEAVVPSIAFPSY